MLDLIISYLNFFIIGIKFIVKLIAFQPPKPKGYRLKNCKNEIQENINLDLIDKIEILFLIKSSNEKKDNNKKEKDNKEKLKNIKKKLEYREAPRFLSDLELINFKTEDKSTEIPAFLFKPKFGQPVIKYLIIYCHGNSGDIGTSFTECQLLCYNLNCNVLCFEYPGYGLSKDINNTNEKRSYYNIRETYKFARNSLKYKPENIIIYGFSLGTGIAFDLACDRNYPIGGVILQSPFLSIIRTIYDFKSTYYFDLFNNCDKAKYCRAKALFIHGNKDKIVPYIHGRILSKIIPQQYFYDFYTVDGANHNDILNFKREKLYANIQNFLFALEQSKSKDIGENEDRFSDFSSLKGLDVNRPISLQDKNDKTDYENNLKIDLDSINIKVSSHDELKALEPKENAERNFYNNPSFNKKNSKIIEKKENMGDKTEDNTKNENRIFSNCNYSDEKEEKSVIEEPKYFDSTSKKLNLENYNKLEGNNEINSNEINNNEKLEVNNNINYDNSEINNNINNENNDIINKINNENYKNVSDINNLDNEKHEINNNINNENNIKDETNNDNYKVENDMDISFDKRN